jgi:hypothetical protein
MINRLGVGGIEAEAIIHGEVIVILLLKVFRFKITIEL